jgi:hypothetical protein
MFPDVLFGFVIHTLNNVDANAVVCYYGLYRLDQAWKQHFDDFLKPNTDTTSPKDSHE